MPLRASVTADAVGTNPGDPAPILIDGADTPCTANGLQGYTPVPGDRLLVDKVGGALEIIQFLSTGSVPFVATYRQDTDPALAGPVPDGAIWFDTAHNSAVNTRENGAWVTLQYGADAIDIPSVQSVVVNQGFVLAGGVAELSNGATNPTAAPVLDSYYPNYHTTLYGTGQDVSAFFAGLENYHSDSTKWVTSSIFFGTNIRVLNKSDGQLGQFPDPTNGKGWCANFYGWGGIAYAGGYYWIIGSDNDRNVDTYIYAINATTYDKDFELRLGGPNTFNGYHPRLVSDGAYMGMLWIPSSGNLMLRWYGISFGAAIAQFGSDITLKTGVGQQNLGDGYYGDAGSGLGASTLWVTLETASGSNPNIMCWSSVTHTSATRQSSYDFPKARSSKVHAMSYDSASGHFTSIDMTGVANTYSALAVSGTNTLNARYTYYDGDTGNYAGAVGSGTVIINGTDVSGTPSTAHETGYSPTASMTLPRRSWPRITVGPAPDVNNTDATLVDRANRQGVYCALGAGTMWRQTYTTVGQTVVDGFDVMPTSGTPDAHDFSTAQVSLGEFRSAATRLDGTPKTYIDGSGKANIDYLVPPGTIIMSAAGNAPPGYLTCNGAAVSRTTYADLFAAIGGAYGTGDGSTTFNLPYLSGRIPIGYSSGDPVLGTMGAFETNQSGGVVPGTAGDSARLDHRHDHGGGTNNNTNDGAHVHNIAGQSAGGTTTSGSGSTSVPTEGAYSGHAHGGGTNNNVADAAHKHNIVGGGVGGGSGSDLAYHAFQVVKFYIKT